MNEASDQQYDVAIVGSGAGGLVAAITAARLGLSAVIIEKAGTWGGTSSLSGGAVWIPANGFMAKDGESDSLEEAMSYLREVVPPEGNITSETRWRGYLQAGLNMLGMLIDEGVALQREPKQPDYDSQSPHGRIGRQVEPNISDAKKLGTWRATLRRYPGDNYAVRLGELPIINQGLATFAGMMTMVKVGVRHKIRKLLGQDPVGMGTALVTELGCAARRHGVPMLLNTSVSDIIVEDGRVVGIQCTKDGAVSRVNTRMGVILCMGGFAHAPEMRSEWQGVDGSWSSASPDDTGDVIGLARKLDADLAMLDTAWWGCSVMYPGDIPGFIVTERTMPGGIIVDGTGKRFTNEARDYNVVGSDMIAKQVKNAWLIIDARHRRRYRFGPLLPGQSPKELVDAGFFKKADTIEELARLCDIDPGTLAQTVTRFNEMARVGKDTDFGRGADLYQNYWGDPNNRPNPNLGPLVHAPFLATRVYPGDLGTRGGLVTDEHGRVLRRSGTPIEGLYASGNCTASLFGRGYPGAGATLGPAMAFAFAAVTHVAGWQKNSAN